jgi:hypothetical protein
MQTFVTPLFHSGKVKLTQTSRPVTPFGGLVSFIAFLGQIGYVRQLEAHLPWQLTSPNAIPLGHTLTAFLIGVVVGARRFAHTEMARADRALHALLGVARWPGADTVRSLFHRFTQPSIQSFWRPLWIWLLGLVRCPKAGFSVDLDSTVFQRSGSQQGAPAGPEQPASAAGGAGGSSLRAAWLVAQREHRRGARGGPVSARGAGVVAGGHVPPVCARGQRVL